MKSRSYHHSLKPLFVAVTLACSSLPIFAVITSVSSEGALGANDAIDWGTLGGAYTTVASGFDITSSGGVTVNVSLSTGGLLERRDQNNGWAGNFASGEKLLWNRGAGTMIFDFSSPLTGFGGGSQVQANFFGSFTGTISAYDNALTLLGSYNFSGLSTSAGDGSAIFAGLTSSSSDIHRITITAFNQFEDFAIGSLRLKTVGSNVPEGGATAGMLFAALAALKLVGRKLTT